MAMRKNTTVGVAVITHNAKKHLPLCLPPFLASPLKPRVLVVNSSSQDGTVETAKALGAELMVIPRGEFNHGATREAARKELGTDIVVMVTPDAYALNSEMLEVLVTPLLKKEASTAYAKQIPHEGAGFFESFAREFNYPAKSHIRGIEDIKTHGVYTFFCSNSCCAWSNSALDEIGGFEPVLLGEDTLALAKLLQKGHKVAYCANAIVRHSHNYSLVQEFQRHFDTGLARRQHRAILSAGGSDTQRGKAYVRKLIARLVKEKPSLLPYASLQVLAKWMGYQLGQRCSNAPKRLKKIFSSQDFYWSSRFS